MTVELIMYFTAFIFHGVYCGEASVDLVDLTAKTLTVFYDFDRTLLIESFGGEVLDRCIKSNISNNCAGPDEMVEALNSYPDPELRVKIAFGNETRILQLKNHFDTLLSDTNSLNGGYFYILSTSWEPVPAEGMICSVYMHFCI